MTQDHSLDLHIQGIAKSFGDHKVLSGITLEIPDGQFVTLLGPSGCGKTTLLRVIAGFEAPDAGTVRLGDIDLLAIPPHKRPVNTVFQNYALFPHLSVFQNIAFGLESQNVPPDEVKRRVGAIMETVRISALADRKPGTMSGGQKQRTALARALVNEPDVLLLDEPLSALDANLRHDLQAELKALQRNTTITFILVTHDQDEAIAVSDRILVMNEGIIVQDGTPEEVYERPHNRFVAQFIGNANLVECTKLSATEVDAGFGRLLVGSNPAWQKGSLAIRPEDIEVRESPAASNSVPGKVTERFFRGDHWELAVDVQGRTLRVITEPDQEHVLGQAVHLELPADDIQVLAD